MSLAEAGADRVYCQGKAGPIERRLRAVYSQMRGADREVHTGGPRCGRECLSPLSRASGENVTRGTTH